MVNKSFPLKNTFLITCKNYPVPARRNVFHNRNLAFKNEESYLSGTIFPRVISLSRQRGPKWIFTCMDKACKQSLSHSKLK